MNNSSPEYMLYFFLLFIVSGIWLVATLFAVKDYDGTFAADCINIFLGFAAIGLYGVWCRVIERI